MFSPRNISPTALKERRQLMSGYFLYFATMGLFLPYFPVYLRSKGLGGIEIGWLLAVGPLMRGILPPAFGFAADRIKGPRFWGTVSAWSAVVGMVWIWLGSGMTPLVMGVLLYFIAISATIPLLDAAALQHLQRNPAPFGRLRLWGSIGFIVTSFGLGQLFPAMPPALIIMSLVGFHFAFAANITLSRVEDAVPAHPGKKEILTLLRSAPLLALLFALFLTRLSSAPFNGFYSLFVQESGLQGDIVAWTWGIAVAVEVFIMTRVDGLIDRFGSMPVMAFGAMLEMLRWFAYAHFQSPTALLLLAPGHGIAFAMIYVATVRRTVELVPARLRATGQGLAAAATGLGQMAGYVCAGYLHETWGNQGMFSAAGVIGLMTLLAVVAAGRMGKRQSEIN